MAENALGALLAAHALGADIDASAAALAAFSPQKGRGERIALAAPGGAVTLIDESYNANPASMRAALRLLGAARPGPNGRRIAVIGDMLELGAEGAAMHAALAADLAANKVDLLFGAGPLTRALYDAAPQPIRGAWAERSGELAGEVARRCAPATSPWSRVRTAAAWGRSSPRCATISPVRAPEARRRC